MSWRVINGDCREVMAEMVVASIDAIVCDPPYALTSVSRNGSPRQNDPDKPFGRHRIGERGFMGMTWDNGAVAHDPEAWKRALRILKPGGHLVAFGGTRTFHRLTCAIEDAGFEIRDCLSFLYGTGFPKSLDVSKAIDKAAGAERPVVGSQRTNVGMQGGNFAAGSRTAEIPVTAAATDEALRWRGFGTALKPAWEPIILARKPLSERNIAANVQRWGTGALNIGGCRLAPGEGNCRDGEPSARRRYADRGVTDFAPMPGPRGGSEDGRWPANLVLDEEGAELVDEQSGDDCGAFAPVRGTEPSRPAKNTYGEYARGSGVFYGDRGGASRFFYTSKASPAERGEGNTHPTVKPVDLMQWLCRLVTPPGGTVLDPFCGSGSTGIAALREGLDFIGIEQSEEYATIARRRIYNDAPLLNAAGADA